MIISQLTDTHVLALSSAQPLARRRAEDLRRCVADINRLKPLPDAVIHTGDVTHEGEPGGVCAGTGHSERAPAAVLPDPRQL